MTCPVRRAVKKEEGPHMYFSMTAYGSPHCGWCKKPDPLNKNLLTITEAANRKGVLFHVGNEVIAHFHGCDQGRGRIRDFTGYIAPGGPRKGQLHVMGVDYEDDFGYWKWSTLNDIRHA
jgi:hypothetical protein